MHAKRGHFLSKNILSSLLLGLIYRLEKKGDCLDFFDLLNYPSFWDLENDKKTKFSLYSDKKGPLYLMKSEVQSLIKKYENGTKCGELKDKVLAYEYM